MDKNHLLFLIGNIRRDSRILTDHLLKEFNLTRYEWLVLACLKHAPELSSQRYIREYIGIDDSYLTKVLDKLEARHYIIKTISPKDRRLRLIQVNPKQKKEIKKIFAKLDKINDIVLSALPSKEQKLLIQSLQKIYDSLNECRYTTRQKSNIT